MYLYSYNTRKQGSLNHTDFSQYVKVYNYRTKLLCFLSINYKRHFIFASRKYHPSPYVLVDSWSKLYFHAVDIFTKRDFINVAIFSVIIHRNWPLWFNGLSPYFLNCVLQKTSWRSVHWSPVPSQRKKCPVKHNF